MLVASALEKLEAAPSSIVAYIANCHGLAPLDSNRVHVDA
jgi:hypothetical protein